MADGNCVIRFDDKTPTVGNIGKIVRGDTNSNIITFEIPRYHDGEDLKDKSIRVIISSSIGVYTEDAYDIKYSNNLIRFCWLLSSADTTHGNIKVAIEVYGISSSEREYSLHTLPFELEIVDGLRATDSVIEIPEDWFSVVDGKIGQLQALSHKHENLDTLDKLGESKNGTLLYDGKEIKGGDGTNIQVEVLPERSEENLGKIYQYIGETTDDYTHGLFYECVEVYNEYDYLVAYEWKALETNTNLSDYVLKQELTNHAMSTTHITQGERVAWNAKADKTDIPKKVSDLEDDVNLDDIHSHDNATILDGFSESEEGKLLYNGVAVAASSVPISSKEGNIITGEEDGLYATVDLSNYITLKYLEDLELDDVIDNSHKHTNKTSVLDKLGVTGNKLTYNGSYVGLQLSENLYNSLSLGTDGGVYYKGHEHNNKTSLDEIGEDEEQNLTYRGKRVGVDVSKESNNIIEQKDDGLYAKIKVSNDEGNIVKMKNDGLYVSSASVSISNEDDNIITSKDDGLYASIDISTANGNSLKKTNDGLYVPTSSASVSAETGNILTQKDDGLYVKIPISNEEGNSVELKDDGIFVNEDSILTVNGVKADPTTKNVKITLDNIEDGEDRILYDLEDKNISTSYSGSEDLIITSKYLNDQFVNKLEILDKLGKNNKGKLTFNDLDVASSNVEISDESSNIIKLKDDGIYASVDLSGYAKKTDLEDSENGYLKKKTASQTYMPLADYTDYDPNDPDSEEHTKEILGNKIKPQTLEYLNLDDVGELDGASIEQKLLEHVRNTLMHNIGNLSSILITNDEWRNGTLENLTINESGGIELLETGYDSDAGKMTYTLELGTFTSKIYDLGEIVPFQIITYDATFNPYLSNIYFYVRSGTTATYSETTWTDWVDVTDTKDITNINSRYIQLQLKMNTANKFKNVKISYVQIFYGTDVESEVAKARVDIEGNAHSSLKARLDKIETKLAKLNLITEEETEELTKELSLLFTEE